MKKFSVFFKRLIFLMAIVIMLVALSVSIYVGMIEMSIKDCNDKLDLATKNMAEHISVRFTDHMNLLDYVADAVALRDDEISSKDTLEYLSSVQESPGTFFDRIDIVFKDGTQLCQSGESHSFIGVDTFNEMASRGTHISPRLPDDHTGKDVIYCGSPIVVEGEIVALLMGMIDCEGLNDEFVSQAYGNNTQIFLVDSRDGSYLIDTWHPTLDNINNLGDRKLLDGYNYVDFAEEFLAGRSGITGFVSETTGESAYIAYTPVEGFPWTVAVMAGEQEVFHNLHTLRKMLLMAGIVEAVLLLFYVIWNIYIAVRVVKNEEQVKAAILEKTKAEAKNTFLSTVSHDIRTPLNGILGMLTVIKGHENVPDKTKTALLKIEDSAKYLESLTNDVLDLNEIESGKVELYDNIVDIHEFVDNLKNLVQTAAENKKINYSVSYKNISHKKIHCSRVHLQRILVNLISNSIKYNNPGGNVELVIEENIEDNVNSTFTFTVSDNGIGMSEEFQKTMFNSFEQENTGARSNNLGHGLGLPIVKKLVDKMNGTIEVDSIKNKGTRFTVTVCLKTENYEAEDLPKAVEATDLTDCKILVAEDNELNMEIADTLLCAAGAVVTQAVNGRDAVDKFSKSPLDYFDVILMDIMMPEMNGFEATEKIRNLNRQDAKTVPIIAMTAKTFSDDIKKCLESGMNEHIAKPIEVNALLSKIGAYRGK